MTGLGLDGRGARDEPVVAFGPFLVPLLRLEFLQALFGLGDLLVNGLLDALAFRLRGLRSGVCRESVI